MLTLNLLICYFFITTLEGLHIAMKEASINGVFQGAHVGYDKLVSLHLLNVYDVMFLGE